MIKATYTYQVSLQWLANHHWCPTTINIITTNLKLLSDKELNNKLNKSLPSHMYNPSQTQLHAQLLVDQMLPVDVRYFDMQVQQ